MHQRKNVYADIQVFKRRGSIIPVGVFWYIPKLYLHALDGHSLVTTLFKLRIDGDRSFCLTGPRLWNALPQGLHNKSLICTAAGMHLHHAFCSAYSNVQALITMVSCLSRLYYTLRLSCGLSDTFHASKASLGICLRYRKLSCVK